MIDTLLKDQEELAQELTTSVQLPDLDRILNRALDSDPAPRRFPRGLRRRAVAITLLPLAAAAALGALLLTSDPSLPGPPYTPPAPEQGLGLEVSSDANVAVLATNDPSITVLWLY